MNNLKGKPRIDWILLEESIKELIILHMEGKKGHDQVVFDEIVRQLRSPQIRRRAEVMTHHALITSAIHKLLEEIAEI